MFISCIPSERFSLCPSWEKRLHKTEFLAYRVSAREGFLSVKTGNWKGWASGPSNSGVELDAYLIIKKMHYFFSYRHD
jgi:hypothetical protein